VREPVVVFAEPFAVIGCEGEQRPPGEPPLLEAAQQAPDFLIEVADLGVVAGAVEGDVAAAVENLVGRNAAYANVVLAQGQESAAVGRRSLACELALAKIARRRVGTVGVLVVDPEEAARIGRRRAAVEERECGFGGVRRDALRPFAYGFFLGELVVEGVEAARDARRAPENEVAHDGLCPPAAVPQLRRQRRHRLRQHRFVAKDAELFGMPAGHEGTDRGQRERRRGVGGREGRTLFGEGVEVGRQSQPAAERAQAIRPQRVDGDEQHEVQPRQLTPASRQEQQAREAQRLDGRRRLGEVGAASGRGHGAAQSVSGVSDSSM
jgi:hypothetical protein